MAETDRIVTDVLIHAPIERVWELVTSPEHLGRWFADAGAEIDLRPGGALTLTWADSGNVRGRVETVQRPHRFAFRWLTGPGIDEEPTAANSTLADFAFATEQASTRVTVTETGFDGLDTDVDERTALLASHTEGWRKELDELAEQA